MYHYCTCVDCIDVDQLLMPIQAGLERDLWWVELQCAVDASSHAGQNDTSVSFEALRSSIDEGNDGARIQNSVVIVQERYLKKINK